MEARFDDLPAGYDLYFNNATSKKARIYDDGRVLETDSLSGGYFIVQRSWAEG
jgi:hypothetical protein